MYIKVYVKEGTYILKNVDDGVHKTMFQANRFNLLHSYAAQGFNVNDME